MLGGFERYGEFPAGLVQYGFVAEGTAVSGTVCRHVLRFLCGDLSELCPSASRLVMHTLGLGCAELCLTSV